MSRSIRREDIIVIENSALPWILRVPEGWLVDQDGAPNGVIIARENSEADGFAPNLTLSAARISSGVPTDINDVLADQERVNAFYQQHLAEYRVIDQSIQVMGTTDIPAVYRIAVYYNTEGESLTMAQFISRRPGLETTLTVTWASADDRWISGSQALASSLEWRPVA